MWSTRRKWKFPRCVHHVCSLVDSSVQISSVWCSSVFTPTHVHSAGTLSRCTLLHIITHTHTLCFIHTTSLLHLWEPITKKPKMGKINGCLKCLFVFFNVLFAVSRNTFWMFSNFISKFFVLFCYFSIC